METVDEFSDPEDSELSLREIQIAAGLVASDKDITADCIEKEHRRRLEDENNKEEKVNTFLLANRFLEKHDVAYLDTGSEPTTPYIFMERVWVALRKSFLCVLIYLMLTKDERLVIGSITRFLKKVADYVFLESNRRFRKNGPRFTPEDFRKIQNHIVFRNGIYYADEDLFVPDFTSSLPYQRAICASYIEEDLPTPVYDGFTYRSSDGDYDTAQMHLYGIGYLILSNSSGKCVIVLVGDSNTGKSVEGRFIMSSFDPHNVLVVNSTFLGDKFAFDSVEGKDLVSCLEFNMDTISNSVCTALKLATGEPSMQILVKNKDSRQIPVTFKFLFATNGGFYLDSSVPESEAFYNRLRVIPFENPLHPDEMDAGLYEKLLLEKDAILSNIALFELDEVFDWYFLRYRRSSHAKRDGRKTLIEQVAAFCGHEPESKLRCRGVCGAKTRNTVKGIRGATWNLDFLTSQNYQSSPESLAKFSMK